MTQNFVGKFLEEIWLSGGGRTLRRLGQIFGPMFVVFGTPPRYGLRFLLVRLNAKPLMVDTVLEDWRLRMRVG